MAAESQSVGKTVENLLSEISKTEEVATRGELLANLKTAMGNLSRAQLVDQMGTLNLEGLFDCLSSERMDQIQSTCEILKRLMFILDPVESLQKYHESIHLGLSHPVTDVRALVVAHLTRCIETSETSLAIYSDLVISVINQLTSEELSAATEAGIFLVKYGSLKAGKEFLLSSQAIQAFKQILADPSINDSKKFRVFESLTNLATISSEHMTKLDEPIQLLQQLVAVTFDANDPLGQMNGLEILANLVGSPHGLEALRNAGVFQKIQKIGEDWQNIPLGNLLVPGVVKFIGKIGVVQVPPENLMHVVLNIILNSGKDFALIIVAVEALAFIGTTLEGKRNLKARAEIREYFVKIREIIEDSPTEFRVRALDSMSVLFGSDEENEDCLPHWFNILFRDVSYLFEMVRLPFPEIRLSALNFISAIAHLEWAQRHYLRGAGVMEFLLNRDIEPEKECVHAKFRLVSIIADSPTAAKILTPDNMILLKLYVRQGPFYTQAQSTVATKGAGD